MTARIGNSYLYGGNAAFIEDLYERYLGNPDEVDESWRKYFDHLQLASHSAVRDIAHTPIRKAFTFSGPQPSVQVQSASRAAIQLVERKQAAVLQLINAYRFLGVHAAQLDPLVRAERPYPPELDPGYFGLADTDMEVVFNTGSLVGPAQATLREILNTVRKTYCGTIGAEYMYLTQTDQKRWIQARLEGSLSRGHFSIDRQRKIMEQISAAETLEKYLHTRYVGQKRFSLEGAESFIPLIYQLVQHAGTYDIEELVMGMAHRGRLNVLINILGKTPDELFLATPSKKTPLSGDVKYHLGFSSDIATARAPIHVVLAFNPSHLEVVNPVVEGSVRARQQRRRDKQGKLVLPVQVHGDAAFAGQGVVMETLAMSQTRGFGTGGTVHVVINNQIGFTTSDPRDTRSSLYCTDVAKLVEAPIFHVNGDDPEAVVFITELALDFRMTFQKDVVIDLVCFRRLGHNEQDEPMVTQPLMYKRINQHAGVRQLYADKLIAQDVMSAESVQGMIRDYRAALDAGVSSVAPVVSNLKRRHAIDWTPFKNDRASGTVKTGVSLTEIKRHTSTLTTVPEKFKLHARVEKIIADRKSMGEGKLPLDWGMAENLAYASLLDIGYGVRISGQDSARGTFFHRHAVLHDQNREKWDDGVYVPLQNVRKNQPNFVVIDSLLSEEAVLGFEYGYSTAEPNELVVWEAQFGDFANGAQVIIDQFISAGEAKWGRMCGLVMMLPHGYEGQGPEHSSARPERYLQLCADNNIQVCIPSTPAQMFHLLRRQMLRPFRKPLIIFSPKSLLRHKESTSALTDLTDGKFQCLIGETALVENQVKRVVVCSGKVYFDLLAARDSRELNDIALVRVEQLYPFPRSELTAELARYANAQELVWAQEEPQNQGAWFQSQHHLRECMPATLSLRYAGRPFSASPAAGYLSMHNEQLKTLIEMALA